MGQRPAPWAARGSGLTAVALFAFWWSWLALPAGLEAAAYYELLFWGGGHVLQFTWTLLMLVAWLWLADAIGATVAAVARACRCCCSGWRWLGVLTPFVYLAYDVTSVEHRPLLTWMMRVGGGLAILPVSLAVVLAVWERGQVQRGGSAAARGAGHVAVLFAVGGLIGFAIKRLGRADPGALPRLHRRRHARLHGSGLSPAAAAGLSRAERRDWRRCNRTSTGLANCCTSPVWCGLEAMACSARWRARNRCWAASRRSQAWH